MDKKRAFLVYLDYRQHIELLSDVEKGKLLMAMLDYAETEQVPLLDGMTKMAFSFIRAQMDRDAEKYSSTCEKNRKNGAKGGRPAKQKADDENPSKPKTTERFSGKPKKPDNDNEYDNEYENEDDLKDTYLSSGDDGRAHFDYASVVESFNNTCSSLPHIRGLNDQRRKAIRKAAAQVEEAGGFPALFAKVEASDFLTGRSGSWNGCGFDWILKPANLTKILEGNYDNRTTSTGQPDYTDTTRYTEGWV